LGDSETYPRLPSGEADGGFATLNSPCGAAAKDVYDLSHDGGQRILTRSGQRFAAMNPISGRFAFTPRRIAAIGSVQSAVEPRCVAGVNRTRASLDLCCMAARFAADRLGSIAAALMSPPASSAPGSRCGYGMPESWRQSYYIHLDNDHPRWPEGDRTPG
jgi:hypothetical protein